MRTSAPSVNSPPLWVALSHHTRHLLESVGADVVLFDNATPDRVRGRTVIIAPSAAKPGQEKHAEHQLRGTAERLATVTPDLLHKGGATDTAALIEASQANGTMPRLDLLAALALEKARTSENSRGAPPPTNVGASTPSGQKQEKRKANRHQKAGDKEEPRPPVASLQDHEPWPEPVDGNALLSDLSVTFRRFAIVPEHADVALSLWVLFSHTIESFDVAPVVLLTSPEKGCGKSTVLSVLGRLARMLHE